MLKTIKREMVMKLSFDPKDLNKCLTKNNDPLEAVLLDLLHLRSRSTMNSKCADSSCVI